MRRRLCAATLAVLAPLAACGGDAGPPAPAAPVPTPSQEAAPASVQDARDEYLQLLEPSGRSAQALSALLDDPGADVGAVQRAVEDYAAATEQLSAALRARTWPDQVAAAVDELAAQLAAQVAPARAAARGTSVEEISALLQQVPGASAAEQVRDAFEDAGA